MGQCLLAGHGLSSANDYKLLLTLTITKATTFALPENFAEYDEIFVESYLKRTDGSSTPCAFTVRFCNNSLNLSMYSGGTDYAYAYAGNYKLFWNENQMLGLQLSSNGGTPVGLSVVATSAAQTTGGTVAQNGSWVITGTIKIYGRKGS
jgi:hypothetical protein